MNVYDKAHELAKALKESKEYQAVLQVQKPIINDEAAKKMVKDFFAKQMEIEYAALSGAPEDKTKREQLQKMSELIRYNSKAMDYMQAQGRFQVIMNDISKIIAESVSEGLDIIGKE
jgi:cell fate (sporulation/competence/biofilm development) regulator YlbF (YheA/YmcA/DUF963 family)